jgi:L-ascorbate metabolism protein UlaG (beta-lactamase superfamily)
VKFAGRAEAFCPAGILSKKRSLIIKRSAMNPIYGSIRKAAIVLSLLGLLSRFPLLSAAVDARPAGKVTYFAYDGFLVEAAGRKVLVDAIIVDKWYAPPGPALPEQMIQGRVPFDRVDIMLVTHRDEDHFDAGRVAAFLLNHPETTFIALPEVADELRARKGFDSFKNRVREIELKPGQVSRFDLPGIRVDAVPLFHVGGQQPWDAAFSVDLGGFRFFHTGDARFDENSVEIKSFPLRALQPDVLFFQYFDRSEETKAFIRRRVQPAHMIAMHFTPPKFDEVSKDVKADFPAAVLLNHMEARVFEAGQTPWKTEGDYLDQPLPGKYAEVFANGLVSTNNLEHSTPSFSPDGNEVFWSLWRRPGVKNDRQVIMTARRVDGMWSEPAVASFSGEYSDGQPVFSPDGKRLFFMSNRPLKGEAVPRADDIWVIEKRGETWSEPACLDLPARYPRLKFAAQPSVAANGNFYFIGDSGEGTNRFAIFRSVPVNGQYAEPERLPAAINMPGMVNWTPFIAPDESYLLFSSSRRIPNLDDGDIWISRRTPDGGWGDPVILPEFVNSNRQERFPVLSPDGKYLFFTRPTPGHSHDVYWIDAGTIEPLHPGDKK